MNGVRGPAPDAAREPPPDQELQRRLAEIRTHVRDSFGKVVMAMMALPRYRNQTLGDLRHLVLEPLVRDRVALAYPGADAGGTTETSPASPSGPVSQRRSMARSANRSGRACFPCA